MICPYCQEEIKDSYLKWEPICQSCYTYRRKGGKYYELPASGTIVTNEEGNVICHICGQAHSKLGNHIAFKHNITVEEYKERFDIPQCASLASAQHRAKMREYNVQYREHVVYGNLINKGSITRFQTGTTPTKRHNRKKKCTYVSLADADTHNL